MTDNENPTNTSPDPSIFKKLSPKTQGLLRQIQKGREAEAEAEAPKHNMASEQT